MLEPAVVFKDLEPSLPNKRSITLCKRSRPHCVNLIELKLSSSALRSPEITWTRCVRVYG